MNKEDEKKKKVKKIKLKPKINEEDRKEFDYFKDIFPEDKYLYSWLVVFGVAIKYKGQNCNKSAFTLEKCTKQLDGTIKCSLCFTSLAKKKNVLDDLDIEYKLNWSGSPVIDNISFKEVKEMLKSVYSEIEKSVITIDHKLGDNRIKMEKTLEKKTKPMKKK